jgi:signal transduction histidine kinase
LKIIDEEADRLEELISNLLDSSRLQAGTLHMDFQPVRLETILKDMVQRAQLGDFDVDIRLDIQAKGIIIQADPTRLVQVFDNLVSNAGKYATGSILTINVDVTDGRAHIAFHDTGPGIAVEHLEDIFKRFYRLPEHSAKARGSGLGLFICRQIINAHQGEIYAESDKGKGTVFQIYLPCQQAPKKPK